MKDGTNPSRNAIRKMARSPRDRPKPKPAMKARIREWTADGPQWLGHPNPHQLVVAPTLRKSRRDPTEKGVVPIILEQHGIVDSIAFPLYQLVGWLVS